MARKTVFMLLLMMAIHTVQAQVEEPVTWTFRHEKIAEKQYEIIMTASIEDTWHLYAMGIPEGGPIATSFTFESSDAYTLIETPVTVDAPEVKYDENFGMDIGMHSHKAEFRQKIEVSKLPVTVNGIVTFMSCDDKQCLPPRDVDISVEISGEKPGSSPEPKEGMLKFFLVSLLLGFAGVLTPCVFPMIPMTVAFFSQGSDRKSVSIAKALLFGLTIILLYSSLGIIVSLTSAGAGFANTLSTHWIPNMLFFLLFIIFAASFFGAFELVMPSKWVSTTDSKVDRGGMLAAFFLGITTVLVSFSCTGPIIGGLLVEAASGDVLRPTIGMFGFGLAFALPFTLFALFPSMMKKMPKSGGWLNSVKVVLGFIMLAFSLKFASVIDNVYNLGLLSRDIFLIIWIVLAVLLGLYLMGKIKFAHDSDVPHIGVFRLVLIIASFSFALYLVPGLFGSPLKAISPMLPPRETSGFNPLKETGENQGIAGDITARLSATCEEPKYSDFLHFENGLKGYFDLEQGLACARRVNKPVLIDFKGHACANCKVMDARVWSDPGVIKRLKENFVLVALYVDDRTKLSESEVFVSKIDGKEKKTIGKKNEDIEITMFRTNSLPLYAIVDPSGKPLIETIGTELDIKVYSDWLDRGADAFRNN